MDPRELSRRLGTADAVVIGLGSMIGAGVFAAFGPAARAAGAGLLIGLVLAAAIAYCNATASAQLAAVYPDVWRHLHLRPRTARPVVGLRRRVGVSDRQDRVVRGDGADRRLLRAAGPGWWAQRLVAVAAVVALTALNYRGVTKTATLARILVACTLIALAVVVVGVAVGGVQPSNVTAPASGRRSRPYGVLQSAGLLFFAFAGYARIATMGEEVRDPARAIPKAIIIALGMAVVVYLVVGVAALLAAGPERLARTAAPLAEALRAAGAAPLVPVVAVGGALASLGALLALIAGIGRTTLAMARTGICPAGWPPCIRATRCHTTPRSPSVWSCASWRQPSICAV